MAFRIGDLVAVLIDKPTKLIATEHRRYQDLRQQLQEFHELMAPYRLRADATEPDAASETSTSTNA